MRVALGSLYTTPDPYVLQDNNMREYVSYYGMPAHRV